MIRRGMDTKNSLSFFNHCELATTTEEASIVPRLLTRGVPFFCFSVDLPTAMRSSVNAKTCWAVSTLAICFKRIVDSATGPLRGLQNRRQSIA